MCERLRADQEREQRGKMKKEIAYKCLLFFNHERFWTLPCRAPLTWCMSSNTTIREGRETRITYSMLTSHPFSFLSIIVFYPLNTGSTDPTISPSPNVYFHFPSSIKNDLCSWPLCFALNCLFSFSNFIIHSLPFFHHFISLFLLSCPSLRTVTLLLSNQRQNTCGITANSLSVWATNSPRALWHLTIHLETDFTYLL